MFLRKVLFIFALLLCFSVPVTGWAADTYQMTETELTQLEDIFNQLRTAQQQQEQQIETLKNQLTESAKKIEQSQISLDKANQSLAKSAEENKRNQKRLERQRNTWASFAVIVLGASIVRK